MSFGRISLIRSIYQQCYPTVENTTELKTNIMATAF